MIIKKTRKKIQEGHENEMKTFYQNAEAKIKEMIQKGEYEGAIDASYEILGQEPENKTFSRLLVHAENLLDHQMNSELEKYYEEVLPALKAEYKERQDRFIKI